MTAYQRNIGFFTQRTTQLAAATRHDFSAITLTAAEVTGRSFVDVHLEIMFTDDGAAATAITSWLIGIKLGAVAFSDVTVTDSMAFGSEKNGYVLRSGNLASYFNTNFGGGSTQTCQVGIQFGTALTINHTCKIVYTYSFDETSNATRTGQLILPIDGVPASLTTTLAEFDHNAIPKLTGTGGLLDGLGSVSVASVTVEVETHTGLGSATNVQLGMQIDATAEVLDGSHDGTLISLYRYRRTLNVSADWSVSHKLKLRAVGASAWFKQTILLYVTYTYTESSSTVGVQSLSIPFLVDGKAPATNRGSYYVDVDVDVQEPGTITLLQSGIQLIWSERYGTTQVQARVGAQPNRYHWIQPPTGGLVSTGPTHRFDRGSAWKMTKTAGGSAWDSGASSVQTIAGDGYVEVDMTLASGDIMVGFSATDPDQNYTTIAYAAQLVSSGSLSVYELGSFKATTTLGIGDRVRVERVGTTITYVKNGVVFYTSATASSGAIRIDSSISTSGAYIDSIRLNDAGAMVPVTWQNAVGVSLASYAAIALARGKNTLRITLGTTGGIGFDGMLWQISGYLHLTYKSSQKASDSSKHARTIETLIQATTDNADGVRYASWQTLLPTTWHLISAGIDDVILAPNTNNSRVVDVETETDLYVNLLNELDFTNGTLGLFMAALPVTPLFARDANEITAGKLDPRTARDWRTQVTGDGAANPAFHSAALVYSYHGFSYTVSGTITGYSGDGSGIEIAVLDAITHTLLVTTTTTSGGAWSTTVYDNSRQVYATGLRGRSAAGLPGVATFEIYTSPSITGVSPASGSVLPSKTTAITFTVLNPSGCPFVLWVKFLHDSKYYLIYDTYVGFTPSFSGSSRVGDFFTLRMGGGWADDIEFLTIGGVP